MTALKRASLRPIILIIPRTTLPKLKEKFSSVLDPRTNIQKSDLSSVFTHPVCSHHSSARRRRSSLVFVCLNRPAHTVACAQTVLNPSVPEDQQKAGGATTFSPSQPVSKSQHFSKRYTGGTIISSSMAIATKPRPK